MAQELLAASAARVALPAHRMSVEAEASLMNRGRTRNVLVWLAGVALLAGVGVMMMQRVGRGDAYAAAATATTRIGRDHFNAFFSCALPGVHLGELDAVRVQTAFEVQGDKFGKSYATTLDRCTPQMRALTDSVRALRVPKEVRPQQAALVAAASALATADKEYLHYLSSTSGDYDYVAAMPLLDRFGTAWGRYRAAENQLKQALEAAK